MREMPAISSVNFTDVASGPIPQSQVVKLVRCGCNRMFTTLAMAPVRDCVVCIREAAERVKARNAPIPPRDKDQEKADWLATRRANRSQIDWSDPKAIRRQKAEYQRAWRAKARAAAALSPKVATQ